MFHPRLICAALLALVGGSLVLNSPVVPAAPVPKHLMPKEDPYCYSTRVGDRHESVFGGQKVVCVVTKAEKTPDGILVEVIEEHDGAPPTPYEIVVVSAAGVKQLEAYGKKNDEPVWWFKLPHTENNTWADQWNQQDRNWKTTGWEQVEVPAGKYRALRTERTDGGPTVTTYWWAPGVGCIKWTNGNTGREMTAFLPGK
jgi:hypothetical protein